MPENQLPVDREELLATLLESLLDTQKKGFVPDVAALARLHPELATEIHELWATANLAGNLSHGKSPRQQHRHETTVWSPGATSMDRKFSADWAEQLPRDFGDFLLVKMLGKGGMGVVFHARQKSLSRVVALKMIRQGEGAAPLEHARFQAEIIAAARLDHPNIVPVLESGIAENQPFFTMPLIHGQTLAVRLAGGPMEQRECAKVIAQVAEAIHHAHQHGLLHRDLKPSNILLNPSGIPLVTDFGLSKVIPSIMDIGRDTPGNEPERLTLSGAIIGTPCYVAPELVNRAFGNPSPASDVYSLGVILYEMLTGRPPFRAASAVETLLLVLDQEPVRPTLLNPKVNRDLELVCLTCLQKQPATRYQSAGDLALDLNAWLEKKPLKVQQGGLFNPRVWVSRMLRETHHATVLENWGLLWMWHGAMVLLLCVFTWLMHQGGMDHPLGYLALWGGGLVIWGAIFWKLRTRGGPVLFVERQVAHAWAGSVVAVILVFFSEILMELPPLKLSPMLPVITGMLFVVKAGTLSGEFYLFALANFLIVIPMALLPEMNQLLFGIVLGLSFFIPGLKYHRQSLKSHQADKNYD